MTVVAERTVIDVTIANGVALSAEVNVGGKRIVGIVMPAVWTAANLSIQALLDEPAALPKAPVYGEVFDQAGAAIAITAVVASYNVINAQVLPALGRIRIRSGTSAVPVNQGGIRTLRLVLIPA